MILTGQSIDHVKEALAAAQESPHQAFCPISDLNPKKNATCSCHVGKAIVGLSILNAVNANSVSNMLEPIISKRLMQQFRFLAMLSKIADQYMAMSAPDNESSLASDLFDLVGENFETLLMYFAALSDNATGLRPVNVQNPTSWIDAVRDMVLHLAEAHVRQTIHQMREHNVTTYADLIKILPDDKPE